MNNESFGSGTPAWGKGSVPTMTSRRGSTAYQSSYIPPKLNDPKASYAQQQTSITEDTLKTQYQAEGTGNMVLSQMATQRYQLQSAHGNVTDMRNTTELAKKELEAMAERVGRRKQRLKAIIVLLAFANIFCFFRLLICGGSFFCRTS